MARRVRVLAFISAALILAVIFFAISSPFWAVANLGVAVLLLMYVFYKGDS